MRSVIPCPPFRALAWALIVLSVPLGLQAAAATHQLQNEKLRVVFDEHGALTELVDRQVTPERNLIVKPLPGFWRLVFQRGRDLENLVQPDQQTYRFKSSSELIELSVDRVRYKDESLDLSLRFTVRLVGDEVHWSARVTNRASIVIGDFYLPEIGGIDSLGGTTPDDLIWPQATGKRIPRYKQTLTAKINNLEHIETPANEVSNPHLSLTYPNPASMDWFEITNNERGLYFGSYDPHFMAGSMIVTRMTSEGGAVKFAFVKYPFIQPGEMWDSGDYVVSPHLGDWHVAARKYREWALTWFKPVEKPEWVRKLKGMLLVILHQQYGDVMWNYTDLPFLYEEAKKTGFDTVGLFGWTEGGHDNQYPIYNPDPAMGGEAALRKGLADIRAAGGNSILYVQGHLMDPTTDFYREKGYKMAAKTIWGSPYYEQYNKSCDSSFLENFSRKVFVPVWPGDPDWLKLMQETGRHVLDFGPTGIIYDQLGGMPPYPCFDNAGGVRPSEAVPAGRRQLIPGIRNDLLKVRPDFGMMIEHLTDAYAQFPDIVHAVNSVSVGDSNLPQLFRYTFPEVISTTRFNAPRVDPKEANFALLCGFRFELEIRYRPDAEAIRVQAHPELRDYFRSVSQLRDRYWDLLGEGTFQDTDGIANRNPSVMATAFVREGKTAVVMWNPGTKEQAVDLDIVGKKFVEAANVKGALPSLPRTLRPQEIVVAIYQ